MSKFTLKADGITESIRYFENVDKYIENELELRVPEVKRKTKEAVLSGLTKSHGVDKGIYKRSIVINSLSRKYDANIHFQVGSKKHYRLSHLLEHGHKVRGCFRRKNDMPTKAIPHISLGQDYIDKAGEEMYEEAIKKALERGKK